VSHDVCTPGKYPKISLAQQHVFLSKHRLELHHTGLVARDRERYGSRDAFTYSPTQLTQPKLLK